MSRARMVRLGQIACGVSQDCLGTALIAAHSLLHSTPRRVALNTLPYLQWGHPSVLQVSVLPHLSGCVLVRWAVHSAPAAYLR